MADEEKVAVDLRKTIRGAWDEAQKTAKSENVKKFTKKAKSKVAKGGFRESA